MAEMETGSGLSESARPIVFRVRDLPPQVFGGKHAAGRTRKLMLQTIATHGNSDGSRCYPSTGTLATECLLSIRGARKVIDWLRDNGLLLIKSKGSRRWGRRAKRRISTPWSFLAL